MMLESMGISVEFSHHEGAPGQQEIDLRYADALTTADNIMTFRLVMKEVALEQGVWASFMPKPFTEHPGSGMHTHMSLFEGDRNAFYEPGADYQLSKIGRSFIAGPAQARRRDHRRLQPVGELLQAAVGRRGGDRRAGRRGARATSAGATTTARRWSGCRCTSRTRAARPASSSARWTRPATPTWPSRVILAAGLKGIEEGYELPAGAEDDVWALTAAERRALGIQPLPQCWTRRSRSWSSSELVAETLGEHVFDFFLRNKRDEWQRLPPPGHRVRAGPLPADPVSPGRREVFSERRRGANGGEPLAPRRFIGSGPELVGRPGSRRSHGSCPRRGRRGFRG